MAFRKSVRLLSHVKPLRYTITLKPDLESFTFEGEEAIQLVLEKSTKTITLHSKELDIESAEVTKGKEKIFALKISYDEKAETATFLFPKSILKGNLELKLVFRGILNDKMRGFYRSSYHVGGTTRHMATTQFEATDARRAFPCFDEPAVKSVFEVNLIVPPESTAISNTIPTKIREHEGGYKVVSFAPTPKMSTYLLAFIVGDFEHIEKKTKEGVLVRVFVTPGKKHQARFALNCAVKTLSFFTKYFNIPFPLPVLDLIAIPDFSAGAMENWGAITYRESAILFDPEHSSAANKQWVARVIAHELSHQWFGNLVTIEWWTHLWLNEGFASYIEYLALDHLFPGWDIWTQFAYEDLGEALTLDALKNTHPIEVNVHHPDEIHEIFDSVSYSKGASVIRMLANYLGEKDFRDGLRHYLKKHSYSNTATADLWRAFKYVSGKPIEKIMKHWTGKPGYPLLTISEGKNRFTLEQSRFFSSAISRRQVKDKTIWSIPVSYRTDRSAKKEFLMRAKKNHLPRVPSKWLKLNVGESGFFRTRYPISLQKNFDEPIKRKQFDALDRLGLIRDVMATAKPGKLSTPEGLGFALHYKNETDYTVWVELASSIGKIHDLIRREPFLEKYNAFARDIFAPIARKVGWTKKRGENHTQTLLRSMVLSNFGFYGDSGTIRRAQAMFQKIKGTMNPIPADLRGVVYTTVARNGGQKEYARLLTMYKEATLHEEKNRIGRALGSCKDKTLLKKTLAFSLSKYVRVQDSISMIATVWRNSVGQEIAWNFVKANWKTLLNRYGGAHSFSKLIGVADSSNSLSLAKNFRRFFKTHPAPGAARAIEQALENIHSNAAWLARDRKELGKWLSQLR